jgi:hypothetical protein
MFNNFFNPDKPHSAGLRKGRGGLEFLVRGYASVPPRSCSSSVSLLGGFTFVMSAANSREPGRGIHSAKSPMLPIECLYKVEAVPSGCAANR